jgi:hypothetical protein
MKVTIKIDQYDNGISLKWKDADGEADPQCLVALERDKEKAIGERIWDDVKAFMDAKSANVVNMAIEFLEAKELVIPMPKIETDYPGPR